MKFCRIQTYFIITLFMFLALPGMAQKISVANFYLAETDLTANTEGSIVYDQDGNKCALIKVETTQNGFSFDGGYLGIVKVEQHPGEMWLYVPHGLKRLTISHPQLGILRNHDLGLSVQKARTYIMQLTTDRVMTAVYDDSRSQVLELNVSPVNATVILNGVRENADSQGRIVKELSFGSYDCRVMAENYHPHEETIVISDPNNPHVVNISLKQAFGYLEIQAEDEYNGADVYVDDNKVGTMPMERIPMKSGMHKVTISNPLYLPYQANVTIQDSAVYQLHPDKLVSNHAIVTIHAVEDATIWVDGERKGTSVWSGALTIGSHTVECRKESHRHTVKEIKINSTNPVTFDCEAPQAIYGTLHATSTPADADVYIDGEKVGMTPFLQQTVLIGEHKILFAKEGYKSEEQTIVVNEGETSHLSVELSDYCNMQLTSDPSNSTVYLNGDYKGTTPLNIQIVSGNYRLNLSHDGYSIYNKTVRLDGSVTNKHIKLKRNFVEPNEFYMGANYRMNALAGMEYNVGFYLSNVNIECGLITSNWESDKVYWYKNGSEEMPTSTTYEMMGYSIRGGYGIRLCNRIRLTPQIGINHIKLKENKEYFDKEIYADKANATMGVFALNIDCALKKRIKLSLSPEYSILISQSKGFKAINSACNIESSFAGFGMEMGVYLYLIWRK